MKNKDEVEEIIKSGKFTFLDDKTKPNYYKANILGLDAMDIINAFKMPFTLGNAFKYMIRTGKKSKEEEILDLRKAIEYIEREIKFREME